MFLFFLFLTRRSAFMQRQEIIKTKVIYHRSLVRLYNCGWKVSGYVRWMIKNDLKIFTLLVEVVGGKEKIKKELRRNEKIFSCWNPQNHQLLKGCRAGNLIFTQLFKDFLPETEHLQLFIDSFNNKIFMMSIHTNVL